MSLLPYNYNPSFSPYPSYPYPLAQSLSTPAPVYTLLIIGMVLFMAANVMPNLIPQADRVWHVAPMVLQWGFIIIIFALMVQMLGIVPGVTQLHITYVHMAIASLLFILMWNHIVSDTPVQEEKTSSSSSSSREKPSERKKEAKNKEEEKEPSPWDDLRSHPSAFLTTRLGKLMPWPFPMGQANRKGNELWWEKGMPSHVGHFNKPDPELIKKEKEEEVKRKKEKEKAKLREEEKVKEAEKVKEKEKAKKEIEMKNKMKEEEIKKAKEDAKRKKEAAERKVIEDKHKQKLWRTKYLAMIIGISLLNKTLGFLLLLFFSLQMVSQELNTASPLTISDSTTSERSSTTSRTGSSSSSTSRSSQEEKEEMAKLAALKQKEKERAAEASSGSSSSSSKDKDKPISSDAIRKASGSTTVTYVDPHAGGIGVPYSVGFGMHYIHTPDALKKEDLTLPSMTIPSTGMSHPLMTSTYSQYAN
uniref:Uncharacterized protein n=1 Tax=Kwoniella pini CBS 10737 TaxID=1296096 RepID=A0A1B9I7W1_9TREE|nr:uncharacterized protein I206_02365 [Kwoniella pini CBS 10737]OCF51650.1 hypothetical protein I206_02365 [Kwoniella pini CBS 10737]